MRLLICAGGTGGGVYPALAVLRSLGTEAEAVLWVGGEGGMEANLVQRENVPYSSIPAAGLHGVGLRAVPGNAVRLVRGYFHARRIIGEFKPDALLFTGGYVGVAVAAAGRQRPIILYTPDIEPGRALKTMARFADCIAVTAEESRRYYDPRKQVVITGYPTRPELRGWSRARGRQELGLEANLPVLLIAGGSKGAVTLNSQIYPLLPQLLTSAQVVHLTGETDWERVPAVQRGLPEGVAGRYHPYPYLHEMGAALAAADLAVCRAGASTLGELPLFGLPAVLVPYPFAWRYQKVNAEYLAAHKAAVLVEQADLPNRLLQTVMGLLTDPQSLESMRTAMLSLAKPTAAGQIGGLIRDIAARQPKRTE
ncbi:MAG TPA: undecaprenyldiphospho-muramoylpentapeptide beta-N-acetylglucosaminyltransferase [Anaerolineaceae bacterium]